VSATGARELHHAVDTSRSISLVALLHGVSRG
jgi:hypothetical protein